MKRRKLWNIHNLAEDNSSLEAVLNFTGKKEQMLTFLVNNESYGIEILKVKELVRYELSKPPKPVPNVPHYILGVINVRGEIIPVMDLRLKLNIPVKEYGKFDVIIILEAGGLSLGLIVDEVEDVIPIPEEKNAKPPGYLDKIDNSFVKFICERKERIIIVLEPEKFLQIQEKENLREIK